METLDFILKRYNITLVEGQFLASVGRSRWRDMPALFKDLRFTKGVEVGVDRGRFTATLSAGNPDLFLVGVDAWVTHNDHDEYTTDDTEDAFMEAKRRTEGRNVTFIKTTSMEAVKRFADESLDFVFIDGNHDFEHAVEDIAHWSKKVRKGGLVCGHDYLKNSELDFGVIEAVNGWCGANNIKPVFLWRDKCPSWMYVKE
jgi:hypothetical protein